MSGIENLCFVVGFLVGVCFCILFPIESKAEVDPDKVEVCCIHRNGGPKHEHIKVDKDQVMKIRGCGFLLDKTSRYKCVEKIVDPWVGLYHKPDGFYL